MGGSPNVRLTNIGKVPLASVVPEKEKPKQKYRKVPKIERKKMRRSSLIQNAGKKHKTTAARLKFLRKRGIWPRKSEMEKVTGRAKNR